MMFDDNFAFNASRSPSLSSTSNESISDREPSRSVSPCSATSSLPPPPFSVTDLAAQFSTSRIRRDAQICYDSCEAYAAQDDDAGWTLEPEDEEDVPSARSPALPIIPPPRPHSPSQRTRRQMHARLLCSTSHHRDISALVARMVQSSSQCTVTPPEAITATAEPDDEGYDSTDNSSVGQFRRASLAASRPRTSCRRSADFMKTSSGACVSKSTRFRRERTHSRAINSDK
ncbi:hypothetical protein EJ03DRAFT_76853 [Teratosphaeria nubilosa]|uniref:Uncharacterized protein n=1 Tax=Teratosphaeria nubilosa TaxID=161662 RepID=A0A6G1LBI8_9PEZI|nr:hypothetical protein EJ03DRAFT_76853 [Teratosphaeria nubilosa]